jgi:hypothetical protein
MKTQAIALALLPLCCVLVQAADAPRPGKPNIVLFLVDDMGWMDSTP